jgi:hypothetical protein
MEDSTACAWWVVGLPFLKYRAHGQLSISSDYLLHDPQVPGSRMSASPCVTANTCHDLYCIAHHKGRRCLAQALLSGPTPTGARLEPRFHKDSTLIPLPAQ